MAACPVRLVLAAALALTAAAEALRLSVHLDGYGRVLVPATASDSVNDLVAAVNRLGEPTSNQTVMTALVPSKRWELATCTRAGCKPQHINARVRAGRLLLKCKCERAALEGGRGGDCGALFSSAVEKVLTLDHTPPPSTSPPLSIQQTRTT
jgi:hypothetical protein